ncbi:serine/threonine-protein kinase pim-2-like [Oratosquilla oratoria]|uniref:serine/threonine-protein kinase pim-2-like n=1 Tax=Oratosquilla oratoria TaxID=337810 RepID=UPI003F776CC9
MTRRNSQGPLCYYMLGYAEQLAMAPSATSSQPNGSKTKPTIKVVPKALVCRWADPERRVPLEVALPQKVQHVQEVVQIDEHFFERNSVYMVIELIPGTVDLRDYTSKVSNLDSEEARSVFRPLVKAVSECHAAGVAHGDIQLGNVLVFKDSVTGRLKLLEFGMGKFTQDDPLSPEDHKRASIYQLGEFLYYLLCHKFPLSAKSLNTSEGSAET